jgi:signal transduction histidine kinase/CHASE3 domain sensor protein
MKDAETGQRGYLLTGNDAYLEPYVQGSTGVARVVDRLRVLTADSASQQGRIEQASPLIDAKLAELKRTIDLRRTVSFEAALKVVETGDGKRYMDDLRRVMAAMDQEERTLLQERGDAAEAGAKRTEATIGLGALLALLAVSVAGFVITRSLNRQLGSAVSSIRSASAELEAAATQQATGSREQSSASNEVSTTIRELLSTSGADAFVRKEDDIEVILAKLAAVLRRASVGTSTEPSTSLLGPKKILAVDDSATYLQALGDTLRADGYDVILAHSGEEALELLAVDSVDCILLDLMMPGLSGQDTCSRIKATPGIRNVPLLMLTALEDREAMIHGLSVGADDYISKSGDFEILKARMRAQIRRRHFEDEIHRTREELLRKELEMAEAHAARDLAETRARLVDELESRNHELEAFSYSVSHDLRAPLRTIDGFSQALLDDHADKLDEKGKHYLHRVRAATTRMGELIDDLLELSRVGRTELRRSRFDLSTLATRVLAELGNKDPERVVETHVQDGLLMEADSQLMRIVLDNLLGNAWKFTMKAERATIQLGAEERSGGPVYFVRDNGAGFNMTFVARLFSPFQRLHSEADFPGTGIGLATVHRIVDRHGGRIWAEGAVGAGATLYFTVPPERRVTSLPEAALGERTP